MATITKRPSGYQAKIRMKGHPVQSASFTKLGDANAGLVATEAAMREQRYFKTSESEQHTLAELIDKYNRDIMPGKALWARKNQIAQLRMVACGA